MEKMINKEAKTIKLQFAKRFHFFSCLFPFKGSLESNFALPTVFSTNREFCSSELFSSTMV